jgi:thiamine biosynthesis lipoprotein
MTLTLERSAQLTTRLMGTDVQVVTVGDGPGPGTIVEQLAALEARWTRFDPTSELSRIGALAGRPAVVSAETAQLVRCCHLAWQRTGGRFDPTVLGALEALGYDRDYAEVVHAPVRPSRASTTGPAPGLAGTVADPATGLVQLRPGVRIDPGGVGKGLAADLVAGDAVEMARANGSQRYGVLVSVGGDLRVAGTAPDEGWEIEIDHEIGPAAHVNLQQGAVATSSVLRRRWSGPHGACHHVLDPSTGRPVEGPLVGVSVLTAEAWWAEVLATVLLVDPAVAETLSAAGVHHLLDGAGALLTFEDGLQATVGPLADAFDLTGGGDLRATPVKELP